MITTTPKWFHDVLVRGLLPLATAGVCSAAAESHPHAYGGAVVSLGERTEVGRTIQITLPESVFRAREASASFLPNPARLVVDVPGDAGQEGTKTVELGGSPDLLRVRMASHPREGDKQGSLRIVFDLAQQAKPRFTLGAAESSGIQLSLVTGQRVTPPLNQRPQAAREEHRKVKSSQLDLKGVDDAIVQAISFEEGPKSALKCIVAGKPKVALVKDGEERYLLRISGAVLISRGLRTKYLPPRSIRWLSGVRATETAEGVEIVLGTSEGLEVSASLVDNAILVRPVEGAHSTNGVLAL